MKHFLVSIPVVTYNAALFIEETLESIFNQTYPTIELIISDDCSTDSTITIAENWCKQARVQNRFSNIKILTVPKNTGVSSNCNRAIAASSGDWIKFIAGDDILLPNCIKDNLQFVNQYPEARIVFSQIRIHRDTFSENNYTRTTPADFPNNLMQDSFTALDQYQLLLISDRIHYTPSYFFNKQALLNVGGYDESNRLVEDYPMWLKLTSSGKRLYYFHKETVGYRIHSKATNNTGEDFLFKPSIINSLQVRKKYAHPHLPWEIVRSELYVYKISVLFQKIGWNKKSSFCQVAYQMATVYLNPFYYFYSLKKRLPSNRVKPFYQ